MDDRDYVEPDERVYLDDVARDVQDLILHGWPDHAVRVIQKKRNCSATEAHVECKDIAEKLQKVNPGFAPKEAAISASSNWGCLFFVMGFILLAILLKLSKDMWTTHPVVGIVVGVCMVITIIVGLKFFGAFDSGSSTNLMPSKPMPNPPILPKQSELVKCKTCNAEISKTAPACPHCGECLPGFRVSCPKCNSSNVDISEKGYSLGKAAAGALILGPGGLLVGLHGRKNLELHCRSCGKKWKPKNLK